MLRLREWVLWYFVVSFGPPSESPARKTSIHYAKRLGLEGMEEAPSIWETITIQMKALG